jgi:DNA-directed RNA polymerase subunit RPC12/RpoP
MERGSFIDLPRVIKASGYADDLSYNAQLYVRCPACSFEERAAATHLVMVSPERVLNTPCPACSHAGRTVVHHREHVDVACADCGHQARIEVQPWVVVRCPECQSQRLTEENSAIEPPLPSMFGELGERMTVFTGNHVTKPHPWGMIGSEDVLRISQEIMSDEPDAELHWLVAAMFAQSLIQCGAYQDADDYIWLLNGQGNFSKQIFRLTGDLNLGFNAVECYQQAVQIAPDVHNRALCEHNVAMGLFSILVRYGIEVIEEAMGSAGLRDDALAACARAISGYAAAAAEQEATQHGRASAATSVGVLSFEQQIARVNHLIGDLIKIPPADDAQIRVAIGHYDVALQTPAPQELLDNIRRSRVEAITALDEPTAAEAQVAEDDLSHLL